MANMETHVLVFALAADQDSVCMVEPEPWLHGPVQDAVGVDGTVKAVLFGHGVADPEPLLVHSTSWHETRQRVKEPGFAGGRHWVRHVQVDAYIAVLPLAAATVEQRWPAAVPVDLDAIATVARPAKHGPIDPPAEVWQAHALLHGLRHLSLELGPLGDSELRDTLAATPWPGHCARLLGVLAHMYRHDLAGAAAGVR
jgi:hypothetical protein